MGLHFSCVRQKKIQHLVPEDSSFVLLTTPSCADEKVPRSVSSTHWNSHSRDKHGPDCCGDVIGLFANGALAQTFTLHRLGSDLHPLSWGHVQQKRLLSACLLLFSANAVSSLRIRALTGSFRLTFLSLFQVEINYFLGENSEIKMAILHMQWLYFMRHKNNN